MLLVTELCWVVGDAMGSGLMLGFIVICILEFYPTVLSLYLCHEMSNHCILFFTSKEVELHFFALI